MKKIRKSIIVIAIIAAFVCVMASSASALNLPTKDLGKAEMMLTNFRTWTNLEAYAGQLNNGESLYVKLPADLTLTNPVTCELSGYSVVYLDLNGHKISAEYPSNAKPLFKLSGNAALYVFNSAYTTAGGYKYGEIKYNGKVTSGVVNIDSANAEFYMLDGVRLIMNDMAEYKTGDSTSSLMPVIYAQKALRVGVLGGSVDNSSYKGAGIYMGNITDKVYIATSEYFMTTSYGIYTNAGASVLRNKLSITNGRFIGNNVQKIYNVSGGGDVNTDDFTVTDHCSRIDVGITTTYPNPTGGWGSTNCIISSTNSALTFYSIECKKTNTLFVMPDGKMECRYCDVCGAVEYHEHNIISTIAKEATCTETGEKVFSCTGCSYKKTETISTVGHTPVKTDAKPATCTETGLTEGTKCSVCNTIITAQETIPALGHTFSVEETNQKSGCVTYKVVKNTCDVCGYEKTDKEPISTSHVYNTLWVWDVYCDATVVFTCRYCDAADSSHASVSAKTIRPSTCTEAGLERFTAVVYFNGVKYTNSVDRTIPEISHKDVNGKLIPATCQRPAQQEIICELCGDLLDHDEVGKKAPHTPEIIPARAATAKKSGLTEGKKCSVCGKTLTAQKMTLAQVTGLKASTVAKTSIKLSWTKIAGAKYYKVEKYDSSNKKWVAVKTVDTNSLTVKSLKAGTKYQFRVTALDSTKKISGKASATLKTGTLTSAPTVTLKSTKSKTAVASWKKVTGASKYIVYKSTDGKKWTKVTTTTKLTYTLTKLTGGKKIYVKVKAVNAYSKESAASAVKNVTVKK